MFWKLTPISSPVEAILDKENFTLEELLDEEDIIQECKALNTRLINFLRDRVQVKQLLQYIIEEPQEDADSKRTFKFPFMACEIFTCEIDVIFKTLVEEAELMDLLFSFLEPTRPHSPLLAGYFSKVVICLMLRKTIPLMNYVGAHQYVFQQLVDLIGITSIMEVLVRLVGADDHIYPNSTDVMQWLADSNLLEMIVDKLTPSNPSQVHANAAETLCTITRNTPSPLASKLSSSSFVTRIFNHALEDSHSKLGLVHSLSVCISLLDPKRPLSSLLFHSFHGQHVYETPLKVNHETIGAMLPKLGDLLVLLNVSQDEKVLPTTYGELKPPLGKHRLKIVEFVLVLLKTGNEVAEKELISSGTIQRILDLFFEYPYNNALHHHVESIIYSCLESKNDTMIDHIFIKCGLMTKILKADGTPTLSGGINQPTMLASGRNPPRVGNIGHITRIANKITQLGNVDTRIQIHIQETTEWNEWQNTALHDRNSVENVQRWACGRPSGIEDMNNRDSDEYEEERDYDVAALANNLSEAFRYDMYNNNQDQEGDEESGRSLFSNSNWFEFDDESATSASQMLEEVKLNGGGDELAASSCNDTSTSNPNEIIEEVGNDRNAPSVEVETPIGEEEGGLKNKGIIGNGLSDKDDDVAREGMKEFNDTNYWKVEQNVEVLE